MGTSLKVHGLKKLVKDFAKIVHASSSKTGGKVIFINRTSPGSEWSDIIDYHVSGETDAWVEKVIEDWKKMRPVDWEVQQTLTDFKAVKVKTTVKTAKGELLECLD